MKCLSRILKLFFFVFWVNATAQQTGTEQIVSKNIYNGDFTVTGDKDTYYTVVFKNNETFKKNINILLNEEYFLRKSE